METLIYKLALINNKDIISTKMVVDIMEYLFDFENVFNSNNSDEFDYIDYINDIFLLLENEVKKLNYKDISLLHQGIYKSNINLKSSNNKLVI